MHLYKGTSMTVAQNVHRAELAARLRVERAEAQRSQPLPQHPTNGDDDGLPRRIGSYSKGLPHNALGEVDPQAYDALLRALESGSPDDFEAIPSGEPNLARRRKLVNPQSGLAFDLVGADSQHLAMPAPPAFASAEEAGEMVELYWMALLRDVPFSRYDSDPLAAAAVDDLNHLSDFRGPKVGGNVTTGTLFRGFTPGDLAGPYLSQFLLRTALFGAEVVEQRIATTPAGSDFMRTYDKWLEVQRGTAQPDPPFDSVRHFIRNGRDISQYVHIDVLFQAYFDACLILAQPIAQGGVGAPFNPGNPYVNSRNQVGFGTFDTPHIKGVIGEVAVRALKAVWFEKWYVHRRLRPEVFGGRIHNFLTNPAAADYPIHQDVLNSDALAHVVAQAPNTNLLPMAFPEGSPLHPAYGAGHATVAGACVTILKWFFDETAPVANPVVPNVDADPTLDGTALVPYTGPDADSLTVGGELNKLAANIAIGRNQAGVHWRSDYTNSLLLGEAVAIATLEDFRATVNERFEGGTFTTFAGQQVTV
jgi:membrane-associated phospholipid phosphatase